MLIMLNSCPTYAGYNYEGPSKSEVPYEEDILLQPYSVRPWLRYLDFLIGAGADKDMKDGPGPGPGHSKKKNEMKKVFLTYERALKALPGSYKLWYAYLTQRLKQCRDLKLDDPEYETLNNTFERALTSMHKMPCVWILYLKTLTEQKLVTRTRRTFDRALCALPVTQHDRVWDKYLIFVGQKGVPIETSLKVHRRYLQYDPTHVEDFIDFLVSAHKWQEGCEMLVGLLNDDDQHHLHYSKSKHTLLLDLCLLLTTHASEVSLSHHFKADAVLRAQLDKFKAEVGTLWTYLADFYIRKGLPDKARDVFEEGMATVVTVRDFAVIFDSYSHFEETMLVEKMGGILVSGGAEWEQQEQEQPGAEDGTGVSDARIDDGALSPTTFHDNLNKALRGFWLSDSNDVDLRLARLETLMSRRPVLANSVLLRQNPHNVEQWHRRVNLFHGNPARQVTVYAEAVRTVDPSKAAGKPHTLWLAFARLYEDHNNGLANARVVLHRAVQVNFKDVDHLAAVWCAWAEMELRHRNFTGALDLLRRATAEPSPEVKRRVSAEGDHPVQMYLHKSLRLWSLYLDLEESLGTLESTRAVYERIIELKIATPLMIINYALVLEEHKFFEDSFRVYERGVKIFKHPHSTVIWEMYLSKFLQRYGKKNLERAWDLFENAIESAPADSVKSLFLNYARQAEAYGLPKQAMKIYDRATKAVPAIEKLSIYEIYLARTAELFGVHKTREIYEQAITSSLPNKDLMTLCLKYAELEKNMGEIDRARAIYAHASQFADTRSDLDFWTQWREFEVHHGNKDTFREMLRAKRTLAVSTPMDVYDLNCSAQNEALYDMRG